MKYLSKRVEDNLKSQEQKNIMLDLKLFFCISKSKFSCDPNFLLEAIEQFVSQLLEGLGCLIQITTH